MSPLVLAPQMKNVPNSSQNVRVCAASHKAVSAAAAMEWPPDAVTSAAWSLSGPAAAAGSSVMPDAAPAIGAP